MSSGPHPERLETMPALDAEERFKGTLAQGRPADALSGGAAIGSLRASAGPRSPAARGAHRGPRGAGRNPSSLAVAALAPHLRFGCGCGAASSLRNR